MHEYIPRLIENRLRERLQRMPVVALLGSRQCGKSTVAKRFVAGLDNVVFLDLERPADLNKLSDPEALFDLHKDKLICIDEIQRAPELFPVMRHTIDKHARNAQFLVLGSAAPELLRQTSESLAGRIAYETLSPFLLPEIAAPRGAEKLQQYWLRGGYPQSWLAESESNSFEWRLDFIKTFVERDIPQLKPRLPSARMELFLRMCSHVHGQTLNQSKLAASLGVDTHTVRSYTELLCGAFMLRLLPPLYVNLKKRLIKSPKLYVRDPGILHALLGVETNDDLLGHPARGASWEGLVINNILALTKPGVQSSHFRTANGAEIDLILDKGTQRVAVECKASSAPKPERGFWNAVADVRPRHVWIIAPVETSYPIHESVTVAPLHEALQHQLMRSFLIF